MFNDPYHMPTGNKKIKGQNIHINQIPQSINVNVIKVKDVKSGEKATNPPIVSKAKAQRKKQYDPFEQYMADVKMYSMVNRDEERVLAQRVQIYDDCEAFHKLVNANLRLVVKLALNFRNSWNRNLLDLVQEGNIGLIHAVRKYDPDRNVKFSYYASFWIKAYIMKYIQDNWRMVKVVTTEGQRKLFYKLKRERKKLSNQGIEPNIAVLSEKLGVKEQEIVEMDQRLQNCDVQLDAPVREDSDTDRIDMISAAEISCETQYSDKEADALISAKVGEFRKTICKRERQILDYRIYCENPMTLQSLGERLSLSRERIRQIEKHIITKLRQFLVAQIHDFEVFSKN